MRKLCIAFITFTILFTQSSNLFGQNVGTVLQINGKKNDAIKILKSQGIRAFEVNKMSFLLPDVKVNGPEGNVGYGEMVQFKAEIDRSQLPEHLSTIKYQWSMFEDGKLKNNFIPWPDGTMIFFATGITPKRIVVILDVDCLFEVKEDVNIVGADGNPIEGAKLLDVDGKAINEIVIQSEINSPDPIVKEIQVGSGPAPKPPTPDPDTPTPDLPSGVFGLAKTANMLANENVSAGDRSKALDLAKSYTSIANKIRASIAKQAAGVNLSDDDLKLDVQSIMKAIATSNRSALGSSASGWQQWDKMYGDEIYNLYKSKKINTPADWETAFRETATGLEQVK